MASGSIAMPLISKKPKARLSAILACRGCEACCCAFSRLGSSVFFLSNACIPFIRQQKRRTYVWSCLFFVAFFSRAWPHSLCRSELPKFLRNGQTNGRMRLIAVAPIGRSRSWSYVAFCKTNGKTVSEGDGRHVAIIELVGKRHSTAGGRVRRMATIWRVRLAISEGRIGQGGRRQVS